MKITRKERKIIVKYLKCLNESKLPEEYGGYDGVTKINHNFMGYREISVDKIEHVAKKLGYKHY